MNRFWTSSLNSERNMANNSHSQQESVVLAETFEHHWQQLKSILNNVSFFLLLHTSFSFHLISYLFYLFLNHFPQIFAILVINISRNHDS